MELITNDPIYILPSLKIENPPITKLAKLYEPIFNSYMKLYKKLPHFKSGKIEMQLIPSEQKKPKKNTKLQSYALYIFTELKKNHYPTLLELYKRQGITKTEIREIDIFIDNIAKTSFFNCMCWINEFGNKLMNGLYYYLSLNKIPKDIMDNIIIKTPEIYGEFASIDIQKYIESYISNSYKYNISSDNVTVNLDINTSKCYKLGKDIDKLLIRSLILGVVHNKTHQMDISIWMTKMKKQLPSRKAHITSPGSTAVPNMKLLGPREINSGSSSGSGISIWREEESKKLIIHECIHNLNLDFRMSPSRLNEISDIFNISPDTSIKFFEAYTEICACIINSIICSLETNPKFSLDLCLQYLEYETKFSCYQIAKILVFFGFNKMDDFLKQYDGRNRFRQTTSVFSYFFIKGTFLYNLDKFLEFLDKHCHIIDIPNDQLIIDSLFELFLTLKSNKNFIYDLDSLMVKMKNFPLIGDSLRMTCVEV